MRALDRKFLRDLWHLRGQAAAIAMVMASGVSVLVMSLGALEALQQTAAAYYERYRFADVFANVKRAPESLARRIAALPGVQAVETRITRLALLDVEGFEEPVMGLLVSLPERGEPVLNRLALRAGRFVAPGKPDETVIHETLADGHHLAPGDRLRAIVNGRQRTLDIVGVALSPEFVYAIGPGQLMPDEKRFGVVWMGREALAAAFDLEGAFDDVSVSLLRGTPPERITGQLDALLEVHGGVGAYDRSDQISNWFLMSEIDQLGNVATILPVIFLAVAAFLTNMVLNRLIAIERSEIGLLKAIGYSNAAVGWHYALLVVCITALGVGLGSALGWWFGREVARLYAELYRFPFLYFRPSPAVFAVAALVSLGSALLGTAQAVGHAVRLPPAEAMRPPAPPLYVRSALGAALEGHFDQPTRMILRQIARWPGRSGVTTFGIAMAVALLITSLQWSDALEHMVEVHFSEAQHQDLTVGLVEARSSEVTREIARLPGVLAAEPVRSVAARLRAGTRSRREAITGLPDDARLQPAYDASGSVVRLPSDGLVISTKLAELLAVAPGDRIRVEVLEGRRPVVDVPVSALFETWIGTPAFMRLEALSRLMDERPAVSAAHLQVDPAQESRLFARLKELPAVSGVALRRAAIAKFHETMAESLLIFVGFFAAFSCVLAFGVTYNATRVALSERARELATLRVLGLSRLEISYILLGEVALLALAGLPAGCAVGVGIAWLIADSFETELYRLPLVIEPSTFGLAVVITLAATIVSGAIVRRRLDRLDLIAVLKTRE